MSKREQQDQKIKTLLESVETQQDDLGKKPKVRWETNAIFKYPDGTFFNLNTVKSPEPLVQALSFMLEKDSLNQQAAERLGVKPKDGSWNGYLVREWEEDFKTRIKILNWQAKKALLDKTKKKLKALISEETKTDMELDEIEQLLA